MATILESAGTTWQAPPVPMGDMFPYPRPAMPMHVRADGHDSQLIRITFGDGDEVSWHAISLRDACPCAGCRHPESLERTLDQLEVAADVRPERMTAVDGGLEVIWQDGHVSRYAAGWLRARARPEAIAPEPAARLWDRQLNDRLPRFAFAAVMEDDIALLDWLRALREYGLAYLEGAPAAEGTVLRVIERIGPRRPTNFGELFDVRAVVGAISNAYTAIDLPLHIDLVGREYMPGCQFLHCLVNEAAGGDSIYADGFALAEDLRAEDPAAFALLARTRARFRYHDDDTDYAIARPIIELDDAGHVAQVRYSCAAITGFEVAPEELRPVWRAYRAFVARTRDPSFQVQTRMRPGDIACFDNRRVLHGRRAFEPSTGLRHLQGAYVEREELRSRLSVLERRQVAARENPT